HRPPPRPPPPPGPAVGGAAGRRAPAGAGRPAAGSAAGTAARSAGATAARSGGPRPPDAHRDRRRRPVRRSGLARRPRGAPVRRVAEGDALPPDADELLAAGRRPLRLVACGALAARAGVDAGVEIRRRAGAR